MAFEAIFRKLQIVFEGACLVLFERCELESVRASYNTLKETTINGLRNEFIARSCQQALQHLWIDKGVRETILDDWDEPVDVENLPCKTFRLRTHKVLGKAANFISSFMEHLEQLFTPNQVVPDNIFLRHRHKGAGIYTQPIHIDRSRYQIIDPCEPRLKDKDCLYDVDILIFVVSLTGYYQASPHNAKTVRETLAIIEKIR